MLIKVPTGDGRYRYALPAQENYAFTKERMRRIFNDTIIDCDYSENILVVRTLPGGANTVAAALDYCKWPEIIGTVAGDDSILVVIKPQGDGTRRPQAHPRHAAGLSGQGIVGGSTFYVEITDGLELRAARARAGGVPVRPQHPDWRDGRGQVHPHRLARRRARRAHVGRHGALRLRLAAR